MASKLPAWADNKLGALNRSPLASPRTQMTGEESKQETEASASPSAASLAGVQPLGYLSKMAPAPTYNNLSKAALRLAEEQLVQLDSEPRTLSESTAAAEKQLPTHQPEEANCFFCTDRAIPDTQEAGGLPAVIASPDAAGSSSNADSKSGGYGVQLPEFLESPAAVSFDGSQAIVSAEALGKPGMGMAPMEWFDAVAQHRVYDAWRKHAHGMDDGSQGVMASCEHEFSKTMEKLASLRQVDLGSVLEVVRELVGNLREFVVGFVRNTRQQDDSFSSALYVIVKTTFVKGLEKAMASRDAACNERISGASARTGDAIRAAKDGLRVELEAAMDRERREMAEQRDDMLQKMAETVEQQRAEDERVMDELRLQLQRRERREEVLMAQISDLREQAKIAVRYRELLEKEHAKVMDLECKQRAGEAEVAAEYEAEITKIKAEHRQMLGDALLKKDQATEAAAKLKKQLADQAAAIAQLQAQLDSSGPAGRSPPHVQQHDVPSPTGRSMHVGGRRGSMRSRSIRRPPSNTAATGFDVPAGAPQPAAAAEQAGDNSTEATKPAPAPELIAETSKEFSEMRTREMAQYIDACAVEREHSREAVTSPHRKSAKVKRKGGGKRGL